MKLMFILIFSALFALSCRENREQPPENSVESTSSAAYSPPSGAPDYPRAEWVGEACGYWPVDRTGADIDLIVIHTCQCGFYDCWAYLQSCHKPSSSAHYVVRSSDGHVVQMVNDRHIAWHATCVNSKSIGVEHEGYIQQPDLWFTDAMYCSSANLVRWLADSYAVPLDRDHIIGHNEANALYCGGTHTDPGPGWDWDYYMKLIRNGCEPCTPGESRCSEKGKLIETCDESGMTWSTQEKQVIPPCFL